MKVIENIIHIEVADLEECDFKRSNIDRYTSLGYSTLPFIKIRGTKLFPWATLGKIYQTAILEKFGEPLEYLQKAPIKALVKKDLDAERFFIGERRSCIYSFSNEWIHDKVIAASWLNMLDRCWNKEVAKQMFNMSVDTFITNVIDLIKTLNIDLPHSYKRLKQKLDAYRKDSFQIFIHGLTGRIGNAAKVKNEQTEAYLLSLIEHPNQYDDVTVCLLYNGWAKENDCEAIGVGSVGVWRRKRGPEITIGRYGNNRMNERYIRQVKGFAPTAPFMLWESDDNNLDFYYTNPDPKAENKVYNRYVSYIVADSHCGLVLGKSYRAAKSPVTDMVRLAYIDAMYYVRSLTGSWHLPFEVKADHWQKSSLFPFFESIADFVPPAHANKHRGYIEQLFGSPHFKRCQKLGANNYNGNNVTAINPGVNLEALHRNEKNRPLIGIEAENQIEQFFHRLRHMPDISRNDMEALSKEKQWLNKWNTLTDAQKRPISDEQFLRIFGIKHEPQGRQISITNRGVEPQINGRKYSYDLPDSINMMPLIGEKVNVIYDPYDMSRVLITNGEDIRFIVKEATLQPRALQDATPNCRHMLNMILSEKKQQVITVAGKTENRKAMIANGYDSESVLLSQFMPKEVKNNIEHDYISQQQDTTFEADRLAYMDNQIDFDQDFDQ
jgi:hypothetical protein